MNKIINYTLLFIFSIILLTSCTSRKKLLYLQNTNNDNQEFYDSPINVHKLTSGDILYVNFYSVNKPLSEVFNKNESLNSYSMWNSESNVYVNGFSINDSGLVELPLIGGVFVKDLTIEEAKEKIQNSARTFVNDVTVIVKLLNYRYTVIGEVNRPGTFSNFSGNLTIFQAVSEAGDATIFGDKTKTKIIRETKDGKIIIPFDFTKIDVLTSEAYYIKPNDIIYIEPLRSKSFRQNLPNIALIFSSISTIILVINFLR